nr:folylpolyglutamate synthase/dihydrofolate synthase family protein [uncultured Allomuricauda sp.]
MTYQETIQWMFAQLPMYQKKGISALNHKLDNIQKFSTILGNPHLAFKSVHVAGTNGKGSSAHMLASVLQEAGYKVGLYTSPHLKDFRERIRINGETVSKKFVTGFVQKHQSYLTDNALSFFEMTVGMAFRYFKEEKVDIAVVEVGLGGRFDSTNIITPEVSLITNIGYDHMDILGNTLEKIALEKAGIIKPNVPVVISERQTETAEIFRLIAAQRKSKIYFAQELEMKSYPTDLLGAYQQKNSRGVRCVIAVLKGFTVSEKHLERGLANVVKNTGLQGRWQVLEKNPTVICDTAHNQEGLKSVLAQIRDQKFENLHVVIGFVMEKKLEDILPLFPKKAQYYFVKPMITRGLPADVLQEKALQFGLIGKVYSCVEEGFKAAKKMAKANDLVFVGGSTFVVAEVL